MGINGARLLVKKRLVVGNHFTVERIDTLDDNR